MKNPHIVSKREIHSGRISLCEFELEVPFLDPRKNRVQHIRREVVLTHDSVLVLIYHPIKDSFILCEEFRPGVFLNKDSKDNPIILECVAGTIEEGTSPEDTAFKESFEETGIKLNTLEPIGVVYKSPGLMTEKCFLFYSEVEEIPKSHFHGTETEDIRTRLITRKEIYQLMDNMKIMDSSTLLALNWFRIRFNPQKPSY